MQKAGRTKNAALSCGTAAFAEKPILPKARPAPLVPKSADLIVGTQRLLQN